MPDMLRDIIEVARRRREDCRDEMARLDAFLRVAERLLETLGPGSGPGSDLESDAVAEAPPPSPAKAPGLRLVLRAARDEAGGGGDAA